MKRTERAEVRLNPVEKAALEALAKMGARTESEMVRALIRAEAQRCGVWNSTRKEVTQMYKNMNMDVEATKQLADELDRLKAQLREIDNEIDEVDPYAEALYGDDQALRELVINLMARGNKLEGRIEEIKRILSAIPCDAPYVGAV